MEKITKEEIEFAKFSSGIFADWGFENLTKVMEKKLQYKQYIHEMLLLVFNHFQGDGAKTWRFLKYALNDKTYNDCKAYAAYVHQQLQSA